MTPAPFAPGLPEMPASSCRIKTGIHLIARYEMISALLLIGMSIVWEETLPLAVIGLGVLSLIRWISQGRWSLPTPADLPFVILLVMSIISLLITPILEITFPQVCRLLTGIGLFYVIINWLKSIKRVGWITLCAASLAPALGVAAMFTVEWPAGKLPLIPISLYEHFSRLFEDVIHPNVLAGNLAVVMPLVLAIFIARWDGGTIKPLMQAIFRLVLGFVLLFSLLILFLTQSRGSWLAFGMAASLLILLRFRWGWLLVAAGSLSSLGGLLYLLDLGWVIRWFRASYLIGDLASRMELWARGFFILRDFLFTGIGMGTFSHVTDAIYPLSNDAPPHVHNLFLQVGVDLGMPGLLAWLAIFLLTTWAAWRLFRYTDSSMTWVKILSMGILGSQLVIAVHGLFDAVTWGMIRPAPLIWGLWGVCLGTHLLVTRLQRLDATNPGGVV